MVKFIGVFCGVVVMVLGATSPSAFAEEAQAQEMVTAAKIFKIRCQSCHTAGGKSRLKKLNLSDGEWAHGGTLADIMRTISEGVPGTGMLPNKNRLSKDEIKILAKYVLSLSNAKEKSE
ncbi:MAG: c-type cytochrome [Acidobacteria bacterium]|nr:c-type cytochrome [Acidobacteriota bacterium]